MNIAKGSLLGGQDGGSREKNNEQEKQIAKQNCNWIDSWNLGSGSC
ncbi:hypothetical protein [Novipirellula aureliae]|nr:hypothetical protein [Novipirellula aureliae]